MNRFYLLLVVFGLVGFNTSIWANAAPCQELFFSEYMEGSAKNRCLEIYNPTNATVVLTGVYDIAIAENGGPQNRFVSLSGSIAPGEVFVICHPDQSLGIITDQTNTNVTYSGDDAIALRKNMTNIDVIGQIGFDPGNFWGADNTRTKEKTIRRKTSITEGDADGSNVFDIFAEWDGFVQNTSDGFGTHDVDACEAACDLSITSATPTAASCSNSSDGTISISATCSSCDGISYTINGPVNQTNTTGMFTNLPNGTYTINAKDMSNSDCNANFADQTVMVEDNIAPTIVCPGDMVQSADPGVCGANVMYGITPSDNCPGFIVAQTSGFPNATIHPVGVTTNSFTITDAAGNSSSCSFNVTVNDDVAPLISCGAAGGSNLLMNPSFETGNAFNQPFNGSGWNSFGAVFGIDANIIGPIQDGNFYLKIFGANSGTFQDVQASAGDMITASVYIQNASFDPMLPGCTGFIKLEYYDAGNNQISFTESNKLDNTLPQNTWTQVSISEAAPAGTAVVRLVVIMQCNAGGAVFFDDASLSIAGGGMGGDVMVGNDAGLCGALLDLTPPQATDNCGVTSLTYQTSGALTTSGSGAPTNTLFPVGTTMVTYTATDAEGNANSCTTTVQVDDTEAPMPVCKTTTVELNGNGIYSLVLNDVFDLGASSDNCAIASTSFPPTTYDCDDEDLTFSIPVTTSDAAGNPASCNATITVIVGGSLPVPWQANTIGNGGVLGNDYFFDPCEGATGIFEITGGGMNNMNGTTDNVAFASQYLCGQNVSITAKIESVDPNGYGGLMIRETTADGAKQVAIYSNLSFLLRHETRYTTNGVKQVNQFFKPSPIWLRLERQGSWIFAYYSQTGMPNTFQYVHAVLVPMNNCVEIGLASFTFNPVQQTTAIFSNVSVTGTPEPTATVPGITEEAAAKLQQGMNLYPNPANNIVNITFEDGLAADAIVTLRNQLGQVIEQRELRAGDFTAEWNVSTLTDGLYLLEIRQKNGEVEVLRLLKKHRN